MRQDATFVGRSRRFELDEKIRGATTEPFLVEIALVNEARVHATAGARDLRVDRLIERTAGGVPGMKILERARDVEADSVGRLTRRIDAVDARQSGHEQVLVAVLDRERDDVRHRRFPAQPAEALRFPAQLAMGRRAFEKQALAIGFYDSEDARTRVSDADAFDGGAFDERCDR